MTGSLVSSLLSRGGGSGGGSWPMSKVIVKANSLPTAEIKYVGSMYIYAGETTAAYKHGYIYEGTSTPANTKTVSFSPNTISCTGENFWAFWKSEEGAPNNYTEIVKGEMVFVGGNTWNLIGRNTNNEIVKSYQQYDEDWEALGFSFTGTFSEGDVVYFNCAINETDDIIYWWQRIDVQPAGTSSSTGTAVDDQLSFDSQNPVQNKVITEALEETGYNTWKKPEDWMDIRSGALSNSVYFLVAHSTPILNEGVYTISTYPSFSIYAKISNSGTYDIFVDGIKISTNNNETTALFQWADLYNNGALVGGHSIIYPDALTSHIIRITPTDNSNTITNIQLQGSNDKGVLWMHLTNPVISIRQMASISGGNLEAITSVSDEINLFDDNGYHAFLNTLSLKCLPTLVGDSNTKYFMVRGFEQNNIKNLVLKNIKLAASNTNSNFYSMPNLKEIKTINSSIGPGVGFFQGASELKKVPDLYWEDSTNVTNMLRGAQKLSDTFLDASTGKNLTRLIMGGTLDSNRVDGIKGLIVSNEAPFNNATSPQLSVAYTGLSRAALVNLFKSMPYNNSISLAGNNTNITDGILSGIGGDNNAHAYSTLSLPTSYNKIEMLFKVLKGSDYTFSTVSYCPVVGFLTANMQNRITMSGANGISYYYTTEEGPFIQITTGDFDLITNFNSNNYIFCKFLIEKVNEKYNHTLSISADGTAWVNGTVYQSETDLIGGTIVSYLRNASGTGGAHGWAMDLPASYVKVDDVNWGHLEAPTAITKNCTIIGCTGTTDLTADDKAIATGKGWELTVA